MRKKTVSVKIFMNILFHVDKAHFTIKSGRSVAVNKTGVGLSKLKTINCVRSENTSYLFLTQNPIGICPRERLFFEYKFPVLEP